MATESKTRNQLDRNDWIEGAIDVLSDQGVAGLRVEVLAKSFGVTKGSFYWHFKDRQDLLDAVVGVWKEGRLRDIEKQTTASSGKELEQIHHVIDVYSAVRNRKGISIFSSKMGEQIAKEFVTIVDSGLEAENRGAVGIDDEGSPGRRTVLIDKGKLVSYLHDRISAKHYGVEPTGNGRREDFRFPPIPRMRVTFMEAGPHAPEEVLGKRASASTSSRRCRSRTGRRSAPSGLEGKGEGRPLSRSAPRRPKGRCLTSPSGDVSARICSP